MQTPIRHIAIVIGSMRMGGAERATLNLVNELASRGIQCDLILVHEEGDFLKELHPDVNIVSLGRGRTLSSGLALSRYLKKIKPQLIIANQTHVHLLTLWARNRGARKIPVILNEHSIFSKNLLKGTRKTWLIKYLAHRWFRSANAVTAVSEGVANDFLKNFPELRAKVNIIYNPVVTPDIIKKSFEAIVYPWTDHISLPVILGAGRLVADKDFGNLIEAVSLVRKTTRVRLVILGDGVEKDKLIQLANRLNFEDDILFEGISQNPFSWMRSCSVFVLPSKREGLPMTLIEALACGYKVISTDCASGPREILRDGMYGKLVPVADSLSLAKAILESLDNSGTGLNHDDAIKPFLVSTVCEQYLALMQKLISAKKI